MRALLLVLVASAVAAGCGGGSGSTDTTTTAASSGGCESVDAPAARDPGSHDAPAEALDAGKTYSLVVDTNCGSFTIALDPSLAPKTAASFVSLANDGFFDDTIFHRIVPGFVIQGGDPSAVRHRRPGLHDGRRRRRRTRSTRRASSRWRRRGTEAPGTSGSQFFVVTADDAGLPPDYAIVGKVTEGMDVVDRIDALGVGDGPPSQPVVVTSVTVDES